MCANGQNAASSPRLIRCAITLFSLEGWAGGVASSHVAAKQPAAGGCAEEQTYLLCGECFLFSESEVVC